jgi:hypothetical protein
MTYINNGLLGQATILYVGDIPSQIIMVRVLRKA